MSKVNIKIIIAGLFLVFSGIGSSQEMDLYYEISGEGRPIILLHGGPGLDHTYLFPQMGVLSKKYQLITYDQRGSGKSLNTALNEQTINTSVFVEDLESLRKKLGLEKFILMGHSWGGRLAMDYAIRYPGHVDSLILIGSAPASKKEFELSRKAFEKITLPIQSSVDHLFAKDAFLALDNQQIASLFRTVFSVYFYKQEDVNQLTLVFDKKSAISGMKVRALIDMSTLPDITTPLKELRLPTLLLHGKDDIIPMSAAMEIRESIPGAQLVQIPHCGHFPYIESPDILFSEIDRFLENSSPAMQVGLACGVARLKN